MRISDWSSDVCSSDLLAERQVVVAQRNVDLVEQDHVVGATLFGIKGAAAGVDHLLGGLPGRRGGGDVARAVLGIPGEALAHRLDGHLIAEALQRGAPAGLPLEIGRASGRERVCVYV